MVCMLVSSASESRMRVYGTQDQVFLNAVYEQLRAQPKRFRDLIVVHNLREAEDEETRRGLWQAQVAMYVRSVCACCCV